MLRYAYSFICDILIEGTVAYVLGIRDRKGLLAVGVVNVISHALLHLFLTYNLSHRIIPLNSFPGTCILEFCVILLEYSLLLRLLALPKSKLFMIACVMNLSSFIFGFILKYLIG